MPRRYTDEEKRLVLDRLIANHGDVPLTAAESGINERTLYLWRKDSDFADIASPNLKKLPHLPQNDSPSLYTERGLGGEVLPPDTTEAFQTIHDKLLTIVQALSNRIEESIDEAPLNQRVTALSQLIDRIAKLATLLPKSEEEIQYIYEYEDSLEHHIEKKDDTDEDSPRSEDQDQTES